MTLDAASGVIQSDEDMVGAGHPTKDDSLNRAFLRDHDQFGVHVRFGRAMTNDNGSTVGANCLVKIDAPANSFMKTVAGDSGLANKYGVTAASSGNADQEEVIIGGYAVVDYMGSAPALWNEVSASATAGKVKVATSGEYAVGIVIVTAGLTNQVGVFLYGWRSSPVQDLSGLGIARKNFVVNGGADVMQVGAYTLVKDAYGQGPDMGMGMATGTAVSAGLYSQSVGGTLGSVNGKAFLFSGVTLTGSGIIYHRQRIEALDAVYLKNQTATFSCLVKHDVGSNVTFTLYVRKANSADNFAAVTEIGNNGGTAVVTGTDTRLTYTVAMGDCSNGIELEVKAAVGAVTTKNVYVGEVQLEKGSERTDFERLPVSQIRPMCERYWRQTYADGVAAGSVTPAGRIIWSDPVDGGWMFIQFSFPMRAAPALTAYSPVTGASGKYRDYTSGADFVPTLANATEKGFDVSLAAHGAADEIVSLHYTADARLL